MEENVKAKLLPFGGLCLWVVCLVVGFLCSLATGSWASALSVLALAGLSLGKARAWFRELRG